MASAIEALDVTHPVELYIEFTYVHSPGSWQYAETVKLHGYTRIWAYAFFNQKRLTKVEGIDSIIAIDGGGFYGCEMLNIEELPDTLTVIDYESFRNCKALALTSLPASVVSIGSNAFRGCVGLSALTFKGTPKTIFADAFTDCTGLAVINVPWAEGAVSGAPWGATNATINYNYSEE